MLYASAKYLRLFFGENLKLNHTSPIFLLAELFQYTMYFFKITSQLHVTIVTFIFMQLVQHLHMLLYLCNRNCCVLDDLLTALIKTCLLTVYHFKYNNRYVLTSYFPKVCYTTLNTTRFQLTLLHLTMSYYLC